MILETLGTGSRNNVEEPLIKELREGLRKITPEISLLSSSLERLPGAEALDPSEKLAVIRGLERVWHIMRLLNLLSIYFGDRIFFGGGSILNYIYMARFREPPRLTFDLDSSWHRKVSAKRVLLAEMMMFNKWLEEADLTLKIPMSGDRFARIFIVEYDAEKDHFPDVLNLRIPIITRYDGRPFYEYLGLRDYQPISRFREVFREVLGVEDAKIDYLRLEISLNMAGAPVEEISATDIFGLEHRIRITGLGYQLASKLENRVGKHFGEDLRYAIHDILKAVLDLRLLDRIDMGEVSRYIRNADLVKENSQRNIEALLAIGRELWDRNYHYALARKRYTLEEIAERVKNNIQAVFH
jgi:hypothetical protein